MRALLATFLPPPYRIRPAASREQIPQPALHWPGAPAGRTLPCQPLCPRAAFHSPLHTSHLFVRDARRASHIPCVLPCILPNAPGWVLLPYSSHRALNACVPQFPAKHRRAPLHVVSALSFTLQD
eukprot:6191644-Prymnesium_polylepis.1